MSDNALGVFVVVLLLTGGVTALRIANHRSCLAVATLEFRDLTFNHGADRQAPLPVLTLKSDRRTGDPSHLAD